MQTHYQLFTVDDLQNDEAQIIGILQAIKQGKLSDDIRLLNYYKELPVIFDAALVQVDRGSAGIRVHELQAAAMVHQKQAFIKSGHLTHDVIAKVVRISKDGNVATLANFQYVLVTAERRIFVRVRVSERYNATFHYQDECVHGQVEDISFSGVSIAAPEARFIEHNARGIVSIELPDTLLRVPGRLLKVNEENSDRKLVIEMEVDSRSERMISQFIFSQQSRIIRELKDVYQAAPDLQLF